MIKINDKTIASIYSEEKVIEKIYKGTLKVYEAWKNLIASGVPPLKLLNCKGADLVDYKIYGESEQDGTPTPEAPIEIESVGDKTKNLFDINTIYATSNMSSIIDGEKATFTVGSANSSGTFYYKIPTIKGKTYTVSCKSIDDGVYGTYYKSYGLMVSSKYYANVYDYGRVCINTNLKATFTATTDYAYIHAYANWSSTEGDYFSFEGLQVEEGTEATPYEHYGYKIPVKVSKENLLKLKDGFMQGSALEYTSKNQVISKKCISSVQTSYLVQLTQFDEFVGTSKLKPGAYVWGLSDVSGTPKITNPYIVLTTSNETINWNANTPIVLTEEATITQVRSDMLKYNVGNTHQFRILIQEGDTLTEPITTNTYLNEPLRRIGDYADYIDFEKKQVTRVVKELICNGTEDWKLLNGGLDLGYYYLIIGVYGYIVPNNGLNTHLERKTISSTVVNANVIGYNAINSSTYNQARVLIRPVTNMKDYTNTTEWVAYLKEQYNLGTPMKMYYVLTTPEIEENVELPNIPTLKGTTILSIDTTIQPSNLEVVYKGK